MEIEEFIQKIENNFTDITFNPSNNDPSGEIDGFAISFKVWDKIKTEALQK